MAKTKKQMKFTNEELNAMRVNALLQGLDPDSIVNEEVDDTDIDIDDIEIEDEVAPVKKKAGSKGSRAKAPEAKVMPKVPMLTAFERLEKTKTVNVTFGDHVIHYKEQQWPIPLRTVSYNIELIKIPKVAGDAAMLFGKKSESDRIDAENGLVRYMKIVTYETVLHKLSTIGYVRVNVNNSDKLTFSTKLDKQLISENNVNYDKVERNIKNVLAEF